MTGDQKRPSPPPESSRLSDHGKPSSHHVDVSVVIPSYNSERTIQETLESVAEQTFGNWEGLIIDDGSDDRSLEIVGAYIACRPRFRLISPPPPAKGCINVPQYRH